jgi:hypothetical protein
MQHALAPDKPSAGYHLAPGPAASLWKHNSFLKRHCRRTAADDPARFCQVKAWTGTFTLKGTGTGQERDQRYTFRQSVNGNFTLEGDGVVNPLWYGSGSAWVNLNDEMRTPCDGGGDNHHTVRVSDRTTSSSEPPQSSLSLDPTSGTYQLLFFGAVGQGEYISRFGQTLSWRSTTQVTVPGPLTVHRRRSTPAAISLACSLVPWESDRKRKY